MINAQRILRDVVAIGASAGGVQALSQLLELIPGDVPAGFAIVLHRSPYFETRLSWVLSRRSALKVIEPDESASFRHGVVYVAPRDRHLVFDDSQIQLNRGPKEHRTRPAIDPLFVSAARTLGTRVIGVLLSGSGEDGVRGLVAIKSAGGLSLVQDPDEAQFSAMPERAIRNDDVDAILPLARIASMIVELARGAAIETRVSPRA